MKTILAAIALVLAATLGAGAQAVLPACTTVNSCSLFSTSGNGTFQITAIPAGATTITVQIVVATGAVTGPFTAQIQTASSVTAGTALTSPTNCGSSATVGTAAGTYTLTCSASSSQPWSYVAVNFSGGTGTTSGDLLSFQSNFLGKLPQPESTPSYQAWDNFAGPSGWSLSSHVSDSGHLWQLWSATTTASFTLNGSGEAQNTSGGVDGDILGVTPASPNYTVCTWFIPSGTAPNFQVYGRVPNAVTNTGYRVATGSGILFIGKVVAGVGTQIGSNYTVPGGWVAGTSYQMCLIMNGTSISATLNGTAATGASGTDSSIAAAGYPGVLMANGTANGLFLGLTIQ